MLGVKEARLLKGTDGATIAQKSSMVYLGALISDDGRINDELSRRLGAANSEFRLLSRVWRHASIGRTRRLQIFNATIISKLTYGLATAWLNVAERRRLNGSQNRCLRSIWGIQPSYLFRISNKSVLSTTGQQTLTDMLHRQQLLLYGKAARAKEGSLLRESVFCPKSLWPAAEQFVRRRGRPRLEWTSQVQKSALRIAGSYDNLQATAESEQVWKSLVNQYCQHHSFD